MAVVCALMVLDQVAIASISSVLLCTYFILKWFLNASNNRKMSIVESIV